MFFPFLGIGTLVELLKGFEHILNEWKKESERTYFMS